MHIDTYIIRGIPIPVQAQARRAYAHLCDTIRLVRGSRTEATLARWRHTLGSNHGERAPDFSARKANGVSKALPAGRKAIVYPGTMAQHNALKFAVVHAMSPWRGNLGDAEPKRVFTLVPKADSRRWRPVTTILEADQQSFSMNI